MWSRNKKMKEKETVFLCGGCPSAELCKELKSFSFTACSFAKLHLYLSGEKLWYLAECGVDF